MDLRCSHCGTEHLSPDNAYCLVCGKILSQGGLLRSRYRLVRQFAESGGGTVYLAEDTAVYGRRCAIKRVGPPEVSFSKEFAEREGKILAQLQDAGIPGVPDIFDSFSQNLSFFIVMRFIEGDSLSQWADTVLPPWRTILENIHSVGQIVNLLHGLPRPMAHGDIKPQNVLRDSYGKIWLVDFGIALPSDERGEFTTLSKVAWSQGYSPWEQYHGRITPKSDIYALGMTLYRMLVGPEAFRKSIRRRENVVAAMPGLIEEDLTGYPWSNELAPILLDATGQEPRQRPSAADFCGRVKTLLGADVPPLALEDGRTLRRPNDLVAVSEESWNSARAALQDRSFFHWLRFFRDGAEKNRGLERAFDGCADPDEGLENVLRGLELGLPKPSLELDPPTIDFGRSGFRPVRSEAVVRNTGRGFARVGWKSSDAFLSVEPAAVSLLAHSEKTIAVSVYPDRMRPAANKVDLTLEGKTDDQPLSLRITGVVPAYVRFWHRILRPVLERLQPVWGWAASLLLGFLFALTPSIFLLSVLVRRKIDSPVLFAVAVFSLPFLCTAAAVWGWPLGSTRIRRLGLSRIIWPLFLCFLCSLPLDATGILIGLFSARNLLIFFLCALGILTAVAVLSLDRKPIGAPDPYVHPLRLSLGFWVVSTLVLVLLIFFPWSVPPLSPKDGGSGGQPVQAIEDCPFYSRPDAGGDPLGWFEQGDSLSIVDEGEMQSGWVEVSVPRQTGKSVSGWTRSDCLP